MEGSSRPKLKSEIKVDILEYLGKVSKKKPLVAEDFLIESIRDGVGLTEDYNIEKILEELIDEEEAIESHDVEITLYLPKDNAKSILKQFRFGGYITAMGAYSAIIISILIVFFYYEYFYVFSVSDLNETIKFVPPGSDIKPFLEVYKEGQTSGILIALVGGLILSIIIRGAHQKGIEYADGFIKEYGGKNVRIFKSATKIFSLVILAAVSLIVVMDNLLGFKIDFVELLESNLVIILIGIATLALTSFKVAEGLESNR